MTDYRVCHCHFCALNHHLYPFHCRYERKSNNGVVWTDWFAYDTTAYSEDEIETALKTERDKSKVVDKATKLKHEFRKYDAETYENDYKELLIDVEKANDFAGIVARRKNR